MKRTLFVLAAAVGLAGAIQAQAAQAPVPKGYKLLYSQDFPSAKALKDFLFSDPAAWRYNDAGGVGSLELYKQSRYRPRVRSPYNIALLAGKRFGDFVLEAELLQTGKEYGHRDMCVFFGFKDPSNFYYVHLATRADPHAHNIFLVNDEPRVAIAAKTTKGIQWGRNQWHKVRVERTLADGAIRVYFDDMARPIMEATDKHFDYGLIGFGSFDDTGRIAHIRVWGPGLAPEKQGLFR